jgi:hypothetical protein
MKRLVALGALLVVGVEVLALLLHQRQLLLWTSGIAVAVMLVGIRRLLADRTANPRRTKQIRTLTQIRCAAGCPAPKPGFAGRSPPGETGIGAGVR